MSFGLFGSRTPNLQIGCNTQASSRQYELEAGQCQVSRFEILVEFQPVLVDSVLSSGSFSWNTDLMLIMGNAPSAKGRRKSGILTPASCWLLETAESRWVSKYSPTLTMPANTAGNTTNNATTNITIETILLCFNQHQCQKYVTRGRDWMHCKPLRCLFVAIQKCDRQAQLFQDALKHLGQILQGGENVCFYVKKLSRRVLWPN